MSGIVEYLVSEQELVHAVGVALDAVHRGLESVDLAEGEHTSIARTAHGLFVLLFVDHARAVLQLASEEGVERAETVQVVGLHLAEVHAVQLAKTQIQILSNSIIFVKYYLK